MLTKDIKHHTILFNEKELIYDWKPYTDAVVGGTSTAHVKTRDGYVSFRGTINAISSASWASLRSNLVPQDLSLFTGVSLTIRTDGRPYDFEIEYNLAWQDPKAIYTIRPEANEWVTIKIPFANFYTSQLNNVISENVEASAFARVKRFNFCVAKKIVGDFRLDIESVSFY